MSSSASVIEGSKDAGRATLFNKVTDDLVVEVFDGRPFDLFPDVLLLLSLQGELDEDLLQFLIDVVDAKLLEGVVLVDSVLSKNPSAR